MSLTESIVEDAALEWFGELGYAVGHGPHLAPGEPAAEREPERSGDSRGQSFGEVVPVGCLRAAMRRLNPAIRLRGRPGLGSAAQDHRKLQSIPRGGGNGAPEHKPGMVSRPIS